MEALYKRKTKVGLGNREKRKELNKLTSKTKREEMIDSKRRMPLGELNVADPKKTAAVESKKSKAEDRLQQLREWQKARQEAKAKANAAKAKKPSIVLGKSSSVSFTPQVNIKGKPLPQNDREGNKSTASVQKPTTKPAAREPSKRIPPRVKKATPTKRSQPTSKSSTQQNVQQARRTKPVPKTQPPTLKTQPAAKTRSTTTAQRPKSATQSVKKNVPKNKSSATNGTSTTSQRRTRATTRGKETVQQPSQEVNQRESTSPCKPVAKTTVATPPPQPLVIEVPPTTPSKKSYMPVCPSPLLRSRSASCRAHSEPIEPPSSAIFVDEPAWIPGACAPENSGSNKFGDFMDSFSPFKFGGSESNFQFNFNKDIPEEPTVCNDSLMSIETTATNIPETASMISPETTATISPETTATISPETTATISPETSATISPKTTATISPETTATISPETTTTISPETTTTISPETMAAISPETTATISPETTGTRSSSGKGRGRRRSRAVRESEEENVTPILSAGDEEMVATNSEEVTDGIDIPKFRKLHSDVCEKLVSFYEEWEAKKTTLEESNGELEEVLGHIRTATGSAQLIMKQKLKQYIGLVDTAETQSGHRKTTAEDLQGFWDMVYFQVEGLYKMFADLDELEKNNWILSQPSPKKPKLQKKKNISSRKPKKTAGSEAARIKMMERREELKKLKMKAKQQALEKQLEEAESNAVVEVKEEESMTDNVAQVDETESPVQSVDQMKEVQSMMENVKLPDTKQMSQEENTETCELPLKKRELEDAIPPSPLRRSVRIRDRSVFSPMCSPVLSARRPRNTPKKRTQEDAPTGLLISF